MKPTHTPGPWIVNGGLVKANDCYGPWIADTDVMLSYKPNKQHVSHAEQHANANLIAAAPDLLAALDALLDWGRDHTSPTDANSPHALLIAAHNAIAKARGES